MELLLKTLTKLLILAIALNSFAGNLSPDAKALMAHRALVGTGKIQNSNSRSESNSISGMIFINNDFDEASFLSVGGEILTRSPEIFTVSLPIESLHQLSDIRGLLQFTPSRSVDISMSQALEHGRASFVYSGGGTLAKQYSGNGVVIGIIDDGFEYLHPFFMNGSTPRVTRVWDQNAQGIPPEGYNYGHFLGTEADIKAHQRGVSDVTSHGSHVAGIAAGSVVGSRQGVAPDAELVFVGTNLYDNGIVDGMRFIFDYADSVNKPAVINLSLGRHFGPHDGTSPIDRVIEAFTREGRIVVGSAGNERFDRRHFSKSFNHDTVKTFVTIPEYKDGSGVSQLNIWGEPGQTFKTGLVLYENGRLVAETNMIPLSTIDRDGYSEGLLGNHGVRYIFFGEKASPMNGRPNVVVQISAPNTYIESSQYHIGLVLYSATGDIHAWSVTRASVGVPNFDDQNMHGFISGDSLYTVSEVGGTGRETISVGAFTSRLSYENYWGDTQKSAGMNSGYSTTGNIASFSSLGPTVDERIKPDVSAPGDVLISAFRLDTPDGREYIYDYIRNEDRVEYPIGGMSGTSMAAPFITGVVALMLEADPTLTPRDIKSILSESAYTDEFTGSLLTRSDSISWGVGKIDADKALELVENALENSPQNSTDNPNVRFVRSGESHKLKLEISLERAERVNVQLIDLRGRVVFESNSALSHGITSIPVSQTYIGRGVYLYNITGDNINISGKIGKLE